MAKVFTFFELLEKGCEFADKESEKLDLINQMADFCENSGQYFDNDEYIDLEVSLVAAIEYGNDDFYSYKEFLVYYNKAVSNFIKLKNWYYEKFEKNTIITFAICSYGNKEKLSACLENILKYPRTDVEVVVLDCSKDKSVKGIMNKFETQNIKYFKGKSDDKIQNEIDLISLCESLYIFPVDEDYIFMEESIPYMIDIIWENPGLCQIFCPRPNGLLLTAENVEWEILGDSDERFEIAKDIKSKTGYGFKKELIDIKRCTKEKEEFKKVEDIYKYIIDKIAYDGETAIFCLPMYAKQE